MALGELLTFWHCAWWKRQGKRRGGADRRERWQTGNEKSENKGEAIVKGDAGSLFPLRGIFMTLNLIFKKEAKLPKNVQISFVGYPENWRPLTANGTLHWLEEEINSSCHKFSVSLTKVTFKALQNSRLLCFVLYNGPKTNKCSLSSGKHSGLPVSSCWMSLIK